MDPSEPARAELAGQSELNRWQRRLMPFMVTAIAALAVFFFVSTFVQLERLNKAVEVPTDSALDAVLARVDAREAQLPFAEASELLRWKTMALLERGVIQQRYAQVNSALLMRAWTRQLGFVTGMMLSFFGAIFILAKMSDSGTQLNAEGSGMKGALSTSSPGIVLCVLGTGLMLLTLTVSYEATTTDTPVYLTPLAQPEATPLPPPPERSTPRKELGADEQARLVEEEQRLIDARKAALESANTAATP